MNSESLEEKSLLLKPVQIHVLVHTGRRVFRDTAWIRILSLCVLLGHLNPLGRSENLSRNSFSTSGQELFPFGIISKNSFLAAIKHELKRV